MAHYFHDSLKVKHANENIFCISDEHGTLFSTPETVDKAFIDYFSKQLGNYEEFCPDLDLISTLDLPCISQFEVASLVKPVSDEEIKSTLFSMNQHFAGGPDGLNVTFFKSTWGVLGNEFCQAIHNFFNKCKLLGEVNCTNLALIPKVSPPLSVTSFRPISCCNVVYKCISKILASRLASVLPSIVSNSQAAFIHSRNILDNVMLAQELLNGYCRGNVTPAAALKIDISKAYDSIYWASIVRIMAKIGFPKIFVSWVYVCISTPAFSVVINGSLLVFSEVKKIIKYHPKCSKLHISSIIFADDVMLFTKPEFSSISGLMKALQSFYLMTGLSINQSKSFMIVAGVSDVQAAALYQFFGFSCMASDMSYLGLPLITKRIATADCLILYNKITKVMSDWCNRHISQCGRLVLIKAVVFPSLVYWARSFILPSKLLLMVRSAMNRYFWTGIVHNNKLIPCSFSLFESSLKHGGLGIIYVRKWNTAAFSKHFDDLILKKDSLWVRWTWQYNIKRRHFWCMDIPQNCSSNWRNLLKLDVYLLMVQYHLQTNSSVSFWHDPWVKKGLILSKVCEFSLIQQTGIHSNAKATDFLFEGNMMLPYNSNQMIRQLWRDVMNFFKCVDHSISVSWEQKLHNVAIVYKFLSVSIPLPAARWYYVLWTKESMPRENLMMWKVVSHALMTTDVLDRFGLTVCTSCVFCHMCDETVDHLFFECSALLMLMSSISSTTGFVLNSANSVSAWEIIHAAATRRKDEDSAMVVCLKIYFDVIWRESNARIFENLSKTYDTLWFEVRNRVYMQLQRSNRQYPVGILHVWAV